ncbi:hypothetical protein RDV64_01455 [Acuticoccus sp. MNP-M23]|uniref:hypothetical protein n=1 Tax=Acuticoccus sp. MNP-M23 TaxID=3072793 RepID=UPI002814989A|nr:hypothetical protein [Acuticoccus sp. MNP-M23]WMS43098.1 hypothetical protein RDV64_01455 [Acuticoccus sp. MNP-M23]
MELKDLVRLAGKGSNLDSVPDGGELPDLDAVFEELANWEAQLRHLDLSAIDKAAGTEVRP